MARTCLSASERGGHFSFVSENVMAQTKRCDHCALWVPTKDDRGECHARAPRPMPQFPNLSPGAAQQLNYAPITTAEFWCDEFKQGGN
jgi:hypothetical protein